MSFSWYFHAFNVSSLKNDILKGKGDYDAEDEIDKISQEVRIALQSANFDYNQLAKKHWEFLDQYLINSILNLPEREQVSPDHAHWRIWSDFAELKYAEPKEVFVALSGDGRRYNFIEKKKSIFSTLKSFYEALNWKNRPDYVIIADVELEIFTQSLERIFKTDDEELFKKYGGKEELRPYFLEPFLTAIEKEKGILGLLT